MKEKLNPIETKILSVLIKGKMYMTTGRISKRAKVSWNTAFAYLIKFHNFGWVERLGDRTLYWRAIID